MLYRLICIAIVFLLLFANSCRSSNMEMNIQFDQVSGLNQGSRLIFDNKTAGKVETVLTKPNGTYSVRVNIDEEFRDVVTEYSQFRLIDDPAGPQRKAVEMVLLQPGGKKLKDGATVTGISRDLGIGARMQQELEEGYQYLKKQIDKFTGELKQVPESEEYQRLKKSLAEMVAELERAKEDTSQKIKEQWLPRIERELEALKKKLREEGREQEAQPLQEEVDRIRKI